MTPAVASAKQAILNFQREFLAGFFYVCLFTTDLHTCGILLLCGDDSATLFLHHFLDPAMWNICNYFSTQKDHRPLG